MLKHYIMLKFKEGVSDEHIDAFCEKARAMQGVIEQIHSIVVGRDILRETRSWHVIMDLEVESIEALRAYQTHPVHQALMAFNDGLVADVAALDFFTGQTSF